ncbi:O-antigen ligase family protein [Thermotoga sp. SG1]|uniref:O-antigen ligase family protein n=1 Tax=Thermotoga sp. SG1 TaxID=126739 RepID=UPI0011AEF28B|nr:O-antigen ligase family protein [Thermotoga sp. SG1]
MKSLSIRKVNTFDMFSAKVYFMFIILYTFLSGFVFIEPSPAEIVFALFAPILLIGFSTTWRTVSMFFLLFIPMLVSTYFGLIQGFFNPRFFIIDIYLFLFFFVLASLGYRVKNIINKNYLFDSLMKAWAFAGAINIFAGLFAYGTGKLSFFGIEIIRFGIRLKGFFKDPNVLGPFLVPVAIYYLFLFFSKQRKSIWDLILFTFFSGGVFLTFSRAAWLNLFISIVALMLMLIPYRKARRKIAIFFIIIGLFFAIFLEISKNINVLDINLYDFFTGRLGLQSYDAERFSAQKEFIDIMNYSVYSLFFGIGPGNYEEFAKMATHSLFARYIGERGIFGLITFVVFISLVVYAVRKSYYRKIFIPILLGQFVNSLFIDSLHWRHLWLLIAMIFL